MYVCLLRALIIRSFRLSQCNYHDNKSNNGPCDVYLQCIVYMRPHTPLLLLLSWQLHCDDLNHWSSIPHYFPLHGTSKIFLVTCILTYARYLGYFAVRMHVTFTTKTEFSNNRCVRKGHCCLVAKVARPMSS